jgi:hypothetical protein
MKTISTAFTRPPSSSGVTRGRIVERRTTLTRSNAPPSASASMESHISRESREERPDRRSGSEKAETRRPDLEDVLREDREQGDGAAARR